MAGIQAPPCGSSTSERLAPGPGMPAGAPHSAICQRPPHSRTDRSARLRVPIAAATLRSMSLVLSRASRACREIVREIPLPKARPTLPAAARDRRAAGTLGRSTPARAHSTGTRPGRCRIRKRVIRAMAAALPESARAVRCSDMKCSGARRGPPTRPSTLRHNRLRRTRLNAARAGAAAIRRRRIRRQFEGRDELSQKEPRSQRFIDQTSIAPNPAQSRLPCIAALQQGRGIHADFPLMLLDRRPACAPVAPAPRAARRDNPAPTHIAKRSHARRARAGGA